jgi:hypothetical protein
MTNIVGAPWEVHVLVTCATVPCKYIICIKYLIYTRQRCYLFVKKKVKHTLDQLQHSQTLIQNMYKLDMSSRGRMIFVTEARIMEI